jgi:hypothetical protein
LCMIGSHCPQLCLKLGGRIRTVPPNTALRLSVYPDPSMEDPMLSKTKAKEMRRRASQRRATHRARRAALTLRAETRMAAEMRRAAEAEKSKTKLGSKGHVKSTVKASKPKKK